MTDALAAAILLGLGVVEGPLAPPRPAAACGRVCPGCRRHVPRETWPCRNHECPRYEKRD